MASAECIMASAECISVSVVPIHGVWSLPGRKGML